MAYKDTYEAYINLSRRDLQGLCKKHSLPANKCQSDLAKSLASYFKIKDHGKKKLRCRGLGRNENKKMNSSLADAKETSLVPAKGDSQEKTSNKDHDENEHQHDKTQDAEVRNELIAASPILIESSQEGINIEGAIDETTDGIIDNLNSYIFGVVLSEQDLISQSPMMREEQVPPLEPSSDNTTLKSESPTKCQNQVLPPQCTCNDKSTIGLATKSSIVTETSARPASFQFFVTSDEGINLFVDLNSGPADWVLSLKDEICTNPVPESCSINSLVKGANSSRHSVLSENFQSESVPLESVHNLSDIPIEIEKKFGDIQEEGEENEKMEFSETVKGDSKEVCEISVSEPNLSVPCQNGDKLEGEGFSEELSVLGPTDKAVVLDSATADSLLSSSDTLDEISVPKASDSAGLTLDKSLKRALDQGSEELSQSKKHHVTEESNTNGSFTKILRSSRTTVKEAQEESISALPRRSTRLVSK